MGQGFMMRKGGEVNIEQVIINIQEDLGLKAIIVDPSTLKFTEVKTEEQVEEGVWKDFYSYRLYISGALFDGLTTATILIRFKNHQGSETLAITSCDFSKKSFFNQAIINNTYDGTALNPELSFSFSSTSSNTIILGSEYSVGEEKNGDILFQEYSILNCIVVYQ